MMNHHFPVNNVYVYIQYIHMAELWHGYKIYICIHIYSYIYIYVLVYKYILYICNKVVNVVMNNGSCRPIVVMFSFHQTFFSQCPDERQPTLCTHPQHEGRPYQTGGLEACFCAVLRVKQLVGGWQIYFPPFIIFHTPIPP